MPGALPQGYTQDASGNIYDQSGGFSSYLNGLQGRTNPVGGASYRTSEPGYSPTVFSNANVLEKTIPDLNSRATNLTGTPTTPVPSPYATNTTGGATDTKSSPANPNSYDELHKMVFGDQANTTDPLEKEYQDAYNAMYAGLGAQNDAKARKDTEDTMALYNIRKQALTRQQAQADANKATENGTLFNSGASRYTSAGPALVTSEEQGLMDEVSGAAVEERKALDAVEEARKSGDYQLMEKQLTNAENLRKDRQARQDKLIEAAKTQNDEIAKQTRQAGRDQKINDLISQGITDPGDILSELKDSGNKDVTAKDVDDALKVISPADKLSGVGSDYKTFKELQKTGDPSVKGLNFLQYKTAVANATRKATTTTYKKDHPEVVMPDITAAEAAIAKGADPIKVRQRFIQNHPEAASHALYDSYFKKSKTAKATGNLF